MKRASRIESADEFVLEGQREALRDRRWRRRRSMIITVTLLALALGSHVSLGQLTTNCVRGVLNAITPPTSARPAEAHPSKQRRHPRPPRSGFKLGVVPVGDDLSSSN